MPLDDSGLSVLWSLAEGTPSFQVGPGLLPIIRSVVAALLAAVCAGLCSDAKLGRGPGDREPSSHFAPLAPNGRIEITSGEKPAGGVPAQYGCLLDAIYG